VTDIDFARAPLLIFALADIDFFGYIAADIAIDFQLSRLILRA
jgi:hypothetical protein